MTYYERKKKPPPLLPSDKCRKYSKVYFALILKFTNRKIVNLTVGIKIRNWQLIRHTTAFINRRNLASPKVKILTVVTLISKLSRKLHPSQKFCVHTLRRFANSGRKSFRPKVEIHRVIGPNPRFCYRSTGQPGFREQISEFFCDD